MTRIGWGIGFALSLTACSMATAGDVSTCDEATAKITACMSDATFMNDCPDAEDTLGCMAECILNTSCDDINIYASGDQTGTTGQCIAACPDAP